MPVRRSGALLEGSKITTRWYTARRSETGGSNQWNSSIGAAPAGSIQEWQSGRSDNRLNLADFPLARHLSTRIESLSIRRRRRACQRRFFNRPRIAAFPEGSKKSGWSLRHMQSSQVRNSTLVFCLVVALFGVGAAIATAGSIPFQETWTYDGPQPHGPADGVVVNHQPLNSGGLGSDSLFVDFPNSQFVADNFTAPSSVIIRRIGWHGFYDLNVEPAGNETIRLQIYLPRPSDGLPGDVIYSQEFLNPSRVWTGRTILTSAAPREYQYQVDLASGVPIVQSQVYWLEIAGIGDIGSAFRWEVSDTPILDGFAFKNPITVDWRSTVPDAIVNNSFQLSTIPEPSALCFCLVVAFLLTRRRCSVLSAE